MAAARASQAEIVEELDMRQVPLADGCRSMREWLAGRLGLNNDIASSLARLAKSDHREVRRLTELATQDCAAIEEALPTVSKQTGEGP